MLGKSYYDLHVKEHNFTQMAWSNHHLLSQLGRRQTKQWEENTLLVKDSQLPHMCPFFSDCG